MPEKFDPYRKWLGIPPKDQPPNHYRLLGLELFESDLDVIEGAADRAMNFVRQYQSGEHAGHAARILNEIATARLCLLKAPSKRAYDEKVRDDGPVSEAEQDLSEMDLSIDPGASLPTPRRRKSSRSKSRTVPLPAIIGAGVVAAVCTLFVINIASRGNRPVETAPEKAEDVSTRAAEDLHNSVPLKPSDPTAQKAGSADEAYAASIEWKDSKLVTDPDGPEVDLLKSVDLKRDVVHGKCEFSGKVLIAEPSSRIYLPGKLPDDYQLRFKVRPLQGVETLQIGFLMAGRATSVALDGWGGAHSGLYLDGREPHSNCAAFHGRLFHDELATIVLTVHPRHFHLSFDDRTIIDWRGDPHRLELHGQFGMGNRESCAIGTSTVKYAFESATMTPIKPEPVIARTPRFEKMVDLMPLLDPERDANQGIWSLNKSTLSSPERVGKIYLPTIVPQEYTLSVVVELPVNHEGELNIGLVVDQSNANFKTCPRFSVLELIDGLPWNQNETLQAGNLLKPGVPVRMDCTVTKGRVRVEADGRTIVDWQDDPRRLSAYFEAALPDDRRLTLQTINHLKIRELKIGPPLSRPKSPQQPHFSIGKPHDLLSLLDPARDAIAGGWERDGSALRCRGDLEWNKLSVPCDVPDEYKLTIRAARMAGGQVDDESLLVGLPTVSSKATVVIDGRKLQRTGIYLDDRDWYDSRAIYQGKVFIPVGATHEIVFVVRRDSIQISSGGNTLIDWNGNLDRFFSDPRGVIPGRALMLGSYRQAFRFEKIELEPLAPSKLPEIPSIGADGKLLPLIDVARDTRRGEWQQEDGGVTVSSGYGSRLCVPSQVPSRYVLSADVERRNGNNHLYLGLIVGGVPCAIVIDGEHSQHAGIDTLDGRRFFDSMSLVHRHYSTPLLPANRRIAIDCYVLPDTIVVNCDGKEVIRWHGDPRRLATAPDFCRPRYTEFDRSHLWLGAWESSFTFRDLKLRELSTSEAVALDAGFDGVFPITSQVDVKLGPAKFPATSK